MDQAETEQGKKLDELLKIVKLLREDLNAIASQLHRLVNGVIAIRQMAEEEEARAISSSPTGKEDAT